MAFEFIEGYEYGHDHNGQVCTGPVSTGEGSQEPYCAKHGYLTSQKLLRRPKGNNESWSEIPRR
jgi:hypothetical protein